MAKKTRLFLRRLKSVGLVDSGANRGAEVLITKRTEEAEKAAIARHRTATATGRWDGPAAERRLEEGGPAAYAWRDPDGDATAKSTYRFIHHEVSGDGQVGAANVTACRTGIAVLNGARGGTTIPPGDRQAVYNHLAGHLRDADVEPPDLMKFEDVDKRANVGELAESIIHRDATVIFDGWFGDGRLTREERIALSSGIGAALDAFRGTLEERAVQLYDREPWRDPEDDAVTSRDYPDSITEKTAGGSAEGQEEPPMAEQPTKLDPDVLKNLPEEVREHIEGLETRLAEADPAPTTDPAPEPDLSKREDLPDDVRKAVEAMEARLAETEKSDREKADRIAKLEEDRAQEAAVKRAEAFPNIAKAAELGPVLRKVDAALTDEERDRFAGWLTAANEAIETSKLWDELGGRGGLSDAETQAEMKAQELAKTENITFEQAYVRVLESDRDLRKRISRETFGVPAANGGGD